MEVPKLSPSTSDTTWLPAIVPAASGLLGAAIGAFASHYSTTRANRDREAAEHRLRREQRTEDLYVKVSTYKDAFEQSGNDFRVGWERDGYDDARIRHEAVRQLARALPEHVSRIRILIGPDLPQARVAQAQLTPVYREYTECAMGCIDSINLATINRLLEQHHSYSQRLQDLLDAIWRDRYADSISKLADRPIRARWWTRAKKVAPDLQ
jgi:hypothetical protein